MRQTEKSTHGRSALAIKKLRIDGRNLQAQSAGCGGATRILPPAVKHVSAAVMTILLDEPAIAGRDSIFQRDPGPPAEGSHSRHIQELARRAIRPGRVELQFAAEADDIPNDAGQLADRYVLAPSDVHQFRALLVSHQENAGIREVVDMKELPARRSGSPDGRMSVAAQLRLVEFAYQRRQNM